MTIVPTGARARLTAPSDLGVGPLLRAWRERRRVSQLELALRAGSSARHISFVETGRSRPSEEMVLRLAEHLDVPVRERNALLLAAGTRSCPDTHSVVARSAAYWTGDGCPAGGRGSPGPDPGSECAGPEPGDLTLPRRAYGRRSPPGSWRPVPSGAVVADERRSRRVGSFGHPESGASRPPL